MKPSLPRYVRRTVLSLACMVFLYCTAFSQHLILGSERTKVEVGLNFGPSFFLGDLGGNFGRGTTFLKDLNLEETQLLKGAFLTVYPNEWLGWRIAGQLTYLSGEDHIINTDGEHETYRKERNLDFKSKVWELYTGIEFFPTMMFDKYGDYNPRLKPYGFVGIGVFHFNPKGSLEDANGYKQWYELKPLRTEGQGMAEYPDVKPYKLTQINIPLGVGIKYQVNDKVTLGTELLYRKTFTDYIDDLSTNYIDPYYFDVYLDPAQATIARKISDKTSSLIPANRTRPGEQRGNVNNNDAYFSTVIKIGFQLNSDSYSRNARRQTRCPHMY